MEPREYFDFDFDDDAAPPSESLSEMLARVLVGRCCVCERGWWTRTLPCGHALHDTCAPACPACPACGERAAEALALALADAARAAKKRRRAAKKRRRAEFRPITR